MGVHACVHRGAKENWAEQKPFHVTNKEFLQFPCALLLVGVSEHQYRLSTFNSQARPACLSITFMSIKAPLKPLLPSHDLSVKAEGVPGPCLGGVGLQCGDFLLAESQHGRGNAIKADLRSSQGTHGPDHGPVTR